MFRLVLVVCFALAAALAPWSQAPAQDAGPKGKEARLQKESMALELAAMGEAAQRQGKYQQAIKYYNEALASGGLPKGDRAGIISNRATAYNSLGRTKKALADFNQAIALNPSLFIAYNNRGQIFFDQGKLDKAVSDYGQAIQLKPDYPSPYYNRSLAWERLGKLREALQDAYRFTALLPKHPWAQKRIKALERKINEADKKSQGGGDAPAPAK